MFVRKKNNWMHKNGGYEEEEYVNEQGAYEEEEDLDNHERWV